MASRTGHSHLPLVDPLKEKLPYILCGLLALAGVLLVWTLGSTFLPVLLALILAYVLNPLVTWLEARRIPRMAAVLLVMTLIVVVTAGAATFFAVSIQKEVARVEINLPAYANRLYDLIPGRAKAYLEIETPDKLYARIDGLVDELRGASLDLVKEALGVVQRAFSSTLGFLLTVAGYFITPVYLYYFLADLPRLREGLMALIPVRARDRAAMLGTEIDGVLSGFVRGQLAVCAILAVLYSIGLVMIGIDLAIVIGSLSGFLFIIPYVGTVFGIVVSMTMAFLKFHDMLHPLLCLGWFAIVQAIEGALITPAVVGNSVGLHPVAAILALFIGGQWFGIFGMLLAVPVAAVIKVLLRHGVEWYRATPFFERP
ncbi:MULTISPECIES: AI-2E family transporter [Geobacter]|uniref:Transporter n=2 Tax=Geobacter TaxID=28231 RepID=A0A0C1U2F4_9BACT|nr:MULTISPECIES: AI-2E family transporter [Geobacter]ANA40081.1 AI-2E family transporter [Geobacter anodireducens]KIE41970.1 transporter [Geobacter soli]MBE2886782.1 AI-2E family transporter [Geobacter anodireducens]